MKEQTTARASESADVATDGTPVLLWDIAITWEISYNALYLAGRRGRLPVWRDNRGRIYTTREAAERWYAARTPQLTRDDADPPLPIREAANAIGVSRSTVSRGISRGLIPSQEGAAGIRLVRTSDIRSYLMRATHARAYDPRGAHLPPDDRADRDGEHASSTSPNHLERRRVLVHLLRDLGWRISEQTDLLAYDLKQGDYTTIQNRTQHIRLLSDTVEEVRVILDEQG